MIHDQLLCIQLGQCTVDTSTEYTVIELWVLNYKYEEHVKRKRKKSVRKIEKDRDKDGTEKRKGTKM